MTESSTTAPPGLARRRFLLTTAGIGAVVAATDVVRVPTASATAGGTAAADPMLPFVDHYATNATTNLTALNDAAVDILSGMAKLWRPGTAWDNGSVPEVIEHGLTGFIVRSQAEARDAIGRLGELDRAAIRARFEERFSATAMARRYLQIYERLGRPATSLTEAA